MGHWNQGGITKYSNWNNQNQRQLATIPYSNSFVKWTPPNSIPTLTGLKSLTIQTINPITTQQSKFPQTDQNQHKNPPFLWEETLLARRSRISKVDKNPSKADILLAHCPLPPCCATSDNAVHEDWYSIYLFNALDTLDPKPNLRVKSVAESELIRKKIGQISVEKLVWKIWSEGRSSWRLTHGWSDDNRVW